MPIDGVRNVLPTVTYPDHTTLNTGVWPNVHGITNNTKFDPLGENYGGLVLVRGGHQGADAVGQGSCAAEDGRQHRLAR